MRYSEVDYCGALSSIPSNVKQTTTNKANKPFLELGRWLMGKVPAVHIPRTTVKLGRAAHICDPSVEGRQRQVDPGAHRLASLDESMS